MGGNYDLLAHALDLQFEIRANGFARRQNNVHVLFRREALRGNSDRVAAGIHIHELVVAFAVGVSCLRHVCALVTGFDSCVRDYRTAIVSNGSDEHSIGRLAQCLNT